CSAEVAGGDGGAVLGDGVPPRRDGGHLGGGLPGDIRDDRAEAGNLARLVIQHRQGGQVQLQRDAALTGGRCGGGAGQGGVDAGEQVGEHIGADLVQVPTVAGGLGRSRDVIEVVERGRGFVFG